MSAEHVELMKGVAGLIAACTVLLGAIYGVITRRIVIQLQDISTRLKSVEDKVNSIDKRIAVIESRLGIVAPSVQ